MLRRDLCLLVAIAFGVGLLVWLTRPLPEKPVAKTTAPEPVSKSSVVSSTPRIIPSEQSLLLGRAGDGGSAGVGADPWNKAVQTIGWSLVAVEAWRASDGPPGLTPVVRGCGVFVGTQGELLVPLELAGSSRALRIQLADGTVHAAVTVAADRFSGLALARTGLSGTVPVRWAVGTTGARVPQASRVVLVARAFGTSEWFGFGLLVYPRHSEVVADLVGSADTLTVVGSGFGDHPGAPVVNSAGEVVGLVRSHPARDVARTDVSAVAAGQARAATQMMLRDGSVTRQYLGVAVQPVDRDMASSLGIREARGALVSDVMPDGPAAQAGVRPGDVIVKVGDFSVGHHLELRALVAQMPVDRPITLELVRGGETQRVQTQPATRERDMGVPPPPPGIPQGRSLLEALEVKSVEGGVVVVDFHPERVVASQPLTPGDLLLEVEGVAVASAEDFAAAVERTRPLDLIRLRVEDVGMRRYLTLKRF
jgi:serine protease Do